MFGREEKKPLDVNRMLASAIDAFLDVDTRSENGQKGREENRHIGPLGSVALGAALAAGAGLAYARARRLDVQEVAERVEERLAG